MRSQAIKHLCAADERMAALIRAVGPCRLRLESRTPYEALIRAIAHQQLHGRAADAILGRFIALYPGMVFPAPEMVLASEEGVLRGCGFSAGKVAAIRDICAKTLEGVVPDRRAACRMSDEALIARLVSLRGVGRWTVEMLLIFTLGRPDILPVDDFGVREGYRVLYGLAQQPAPRVLAEIGKGWGPYRSTAAWYLWRAADGAKGKMA